MQRAQLAGLPNIQQNLAGSMPGQLNIPQGLGMGGLNPSLQA
jgi:hypothetical protein